MEKFVIIWSKKAEDQMLKLPFSIRKLIYLKVDRLITCPHKNVKKLRGTDYFRLRVGDYRIIFDIEKNKLRILILFVGHRKNIHKKFWI